jgi:hypothetical protein
VGGGDSEGSIGAAMNAHDYDAFGLEFRRLSAALEKYRQAPGEIDAKIDAYFHVLKAHSLLDVKAKADTWLQTQTKMPKPAEWAGVIIRREVDVPVMLEREAREWRQAELSRWQGEPCGCQSCVEAGVNEKPLRFAPIFDGDTARQVKEPLSGRIVTAGMWLHGWPLFRWYDARATFYDTCLRLGLRGDVLNPKPKRKAFHERMHEIFPAREAV